MLKQPNVLFLFSTLITNFCKLAVFSKFFSPLFFCSHILLHMSQLESPTALKIKLHLEGSLESVFFEERIWQIDVKTNCFSGNTIVLLSPNKIYEVLLDFHTQLTHTNTHAQLLRVWKVCNSLLATLQRCTFILFFSSKFAN